MKKNYVFILFAIMLSCLGSTIAFGQYSMHPGVRNVSSKDNPMTGGIRNYSTFAIETIDTSSEVLKANKGFEHHPEIGTLYEGAPCSDCYELIGERTEINKTFVKKGSNGKDLLVQTSTMPMHYKDVTGNWRTIKTLLAPDKNHKGVYSATEQTAPISINATNKIVSIGKEGQRFQFNNNLELVYVRPDGTELSLGNATWANHTAGEEGVYVKNAWAGIDIEMYTVRGAVKTNFLIQHALPEYATGKLIVRDHLNLDRGLSLYTSGQTELAGNMEIRDESGSKIYDISAATACEKGNIRSTIQLINYKINGNTLDIVLPGNFLNREEASYPVIIDPLVSLATNSAVTGSSYSSDWTVPCVYLNPATVPANITITDIQYAFTFITAGIGWVIDGAVDFRKNTCRSPTGPTGLAGFYWCCSLAPLGPGSCAAAGGATYSILADIAACVPPPQCPSYNLNITMDFYQMTGPTPACATTYILASTPLTITVIGHTVEFVSATASPATICSGSSTSLTGVGIYGVPPYTFTWTPGPVVGSPATVSPTITTIYTLTITDACGITATGTRTVTVITDAPITGTPTVCVGNTTALADATGGAHSWSSSNPGVATVTAAGVVTGVSPGTTTITYTVTGTGCTATMVVTVTPLPTGITGTPTLCVGSTSLLADATGGGTWSSSNPGIASVSAAGLVTGVAAGTATITYSLGGSCYVTLLVTVSLLSPITGTMSVCVGNTTLLSDATGGGTWVSSNPLIATVSAAGLVTGVSPGIVTITYTTLAGCSASTTVTVNDIAPITGTPTVCVGSTTALADAAGAGTWSSSNPAVATVSAAGVVTGVSAGVVTITFTTTAGGCTSTLSVTVSDVAAITGTATICSGESVTLSDVTGGGSWTSSNPGVAIVDAATGVVTGVSGGTTTITYTTAAGCTSTFLITVTAIVPITGTMAICVGGTTTLADAAGPGTWSCGSIAIATVGATTGIVTGISAGTAPITFTNSVGCAAFASVVVNGLPVITGITSVCIGNTTPLGSAIGGGTWAITGATIATINASTGVVSGISAGTVTVTYTTPAGCSSTTIVTVNPLPDPITGTANLCQGFTTLLADATLGGSWASSNASVASIDPASGLVTGNAAGIVTVSYTSVFGCINTIPVTVNGTPPPITGTTHVCPGFTTNLYDAMAGGTWTSANTLIATIDVALGLVTGITPGMTTITYTSSFGCFITTTLIVNPLPGVIKGDTSICAGATSAMLDSLPGGTWSSGNVSIAIVNASTGIVTGVSEGNTTITYTALGCVSAINFTVNPVPPAITGLVSICVGFKTTLSDGLPGGTWTSSNPAVATVDAVSGILNGISFGIDTITYTTLAGCIATGQLTINNAPKVSFYANPDVCIGDTVNIELTSSSAGLTSYTWDFGTASIITSSSNSYGPFHIMWSSAGTYYVTVTGHASVLCPSLTVQDTIKVHNYPNATIQAPITIGDSKLCLGDSVFLRAGYSDQTYKYFWTPIEFFEQNNVENVYGRIDLAGYVKLTVTDAFGCKATDSVLINAQSCCKVFFPNAFSPNGDGLNDVFRPISLGGHNVHVFRVMNRWGQCVYETVNSKIGWDGYYGGQPQEIGTYFYYIGYDCENKFNEEKGEIILVR